MTVKAPSNLTKEARRIFKTIAQARENASMPIAPGEIDLLVDYSATRLRISKLNELLETDAVKASPQLFIATAKQVDASVALSARLAKQLRLEDTQIDPNRLQF